MALWPMVEHAVLLVWLLSLWLVMAVRDVYARKYLKLEHGEVVDHEKWQVGTLVGAAVTGFCWGFSVLSIPSSPTGADAMLLLFVLGGVSAFAGISLASVQRVAQAFLFTALLPVTLWLFSFGEHLTYFMGAIVLGYLVLMLLFSRQSYQTIRSLFSVTEQNKELAAALAQVKELERDASRQVSEQRKTEALIAREQEFRSLAESSPDFIIRYDREGRIRYLNTVLLGLLGLSSDAEAIGKLPGEIWPDGRFDAIEQTAARVVGSGVVETVEQQLPNGGVHHIRIVPERDAAGLIVGSIIFGRDITERKLAEIELQDSFKRISDLNMHLEQNARDLEEQSVELEMSKEQLQQTEAWYRSILQSAPDGMLVVDERGGIIQVNAQFEAMFGYESGELAGCHIEVLLSQAVIQNFSCDRHPGVTKDLFGCRKDGSKFPVDISLSRLPDLDGRVGAICVAVRDVTERQKMDAAREAALAEALHLAQLRSTFMAQMSHELRTPLNGILGYAQNLLMQGESLGEKQVTGLRIIRNSGEHLLSLINGILDHAAIEAGKFELIPGKIELEPFLGAIIDIIRVRAEQKNISFTCDAGDDLPAVVAGDAQRLRQILLNLLSNAIKFTDLGCVTLRVSQVAAGRVRFEVRDSGVGIAADQLENIFLPFEQTGEISRRAGGNGLGLAISRKLVKLMGGDIRVESRQGEGSTFSFEIDMEAAQSGAAKVNAETLAQQAKTQVAQATPMLSGPPRQELDTLYDMALRGSMRDVMRHADRLAERDERYLPFAGQLRQLAKSFQTKALIALIDQYRNEKGLDQ